MDDCLLFWGGGVEGDLGPVGMGTGMDLDGCGRKRVVRGMR